MIPVFRLSDLKKRPCDPNARAKALEMVRKFKESEDAFRKICEEKGIPYTPCVAASPYGVNYYTSGARPTNRVQLGDIWNR
jgi:hypothetical protein